MKHKLCLSAILVLCTIVVFSQPGKVPPKVPGMAPVPTGGLKPMKITSKVALGPLSYKYESDNGHVDISYSRSKGEKDDVKTNPSVSKAAMCLTKEEVRGQKIENIQVIADPATALEILPGGVIDADVLLKSGQFKYIKMDKRKPVTLTTSSNQANKVKETITPGRNNDITDELRTKVHALTRPSNMKGMPNAATEDEVTISTLNETTGIKIGASFFYMGASVNNNFNFSSSKYRYMYLYKFEQQCLPVSANGVSSVSDLFKDSTQMNSNWLYIQQVMYGRRLFVIIESECDMEEYSNKLDGNLELGAVSAELSVKTKGSSLSQKVNIRTITQGGQPFRLSDPARIEEELDNYFESKFSEMDIVPLSYKLTYMDGEPVSLISNAFLDGKNCLDNSKMKIRITKVECIRVDDSKDNEEVYGSASIYYYNAAGKPVATDGKTILPSLPPFFSPIPVSTFAFGTKDAPLMFNTGNNKVKAYEPFQQGKYVDVSLSTLDMIIEIKPVVHEKDNVFNKDDDYITENWMRKTIRQMLMEGDNTPVFEFRRKNSLLLVHFEIVPI
jgi:hypothetical protein